MKPEEIQEQLMELAERLDVKVTVEKIRSDIGLAHPGGYCKVRGEDRIILSKELSAEEKVEILSEALRRFDLGDIFVPPVIRELLTQ